MNTETLEGRADAKCCRGCGAWKLRTEFSRAPNRKDGNISRCKACKREEWLASTWRKSRLSKEPGRRTAWTATELDLMRQLYQQKGANACMAVMPNRTRIMISTQAYRMGLTTPLQAKASSESASCYAVPTHDYTDEDYAMRAWVYPVARGQLTPALMREVA